MRHFHRTHIPPAAVLSAADEFFPALGLAPAGAEPGERRFAGPLGTLSLSARPEGGHYTLINVATDQVGESRLDRNVKRFFVSIHRTADPGHALAASY